MDMQKAFQLHFSVCKDCGKQIKKNEKRKHKKQCAKQTKGSK